MSSPPIHKDQPLHNAAVGKVQITKAFDNRKQPYKGIVTAYDEDVQ